MLGAAVPSKQRRHHMDFTQPYAWLSGVIIVRKTVTEPMSLEKLKGLKVAVVYNYIWKDILETSHPDLDINPASDIEAALKKVSFGMADAMVGYMATASHHIERLGISNLKISGETVSVLDICFAVRKDAPHLEKHFKPGIGTDPKKAKKNYCSQVDQPGTWRTNKSKMDYPYFNPWCCCMPVGTHRDHYLEPIIAKTGHSANRKTQSAACPADTNRTGAQGK